MGGVPGASLVPVVSSVPTSVRKEEAMTTLGLGESPRAVGGPTLAVICIVQYDVMMSSGWYRV